MCEHEQASPSRGEPRTLKARLAAPQEGQAMVELGLVAFAVGLITFMVTWGGGLFGADIKINSATRAAAFAAAHSAYVQMAEGTQTPNPTVVAQAVGTIVARDAPNLNPTVTIGSSTQSISTGATGTPVAMIFYTVNLHTVYHSSVPRLNSVQIGSNAAAPVPPATPGSLPAPTSTPTARYCWVDMSELQSYSNPMPAGTGYYQAFTETAGDTNSIVARWNISSTTPSPISPASGLSVSIYSGTPFGLAYGTLASAPSGVTPLVTATSQAMQDDQIPTLTTSAISPSGAATYTVLFFNNSNASVTTAPAGMDPDSQQGAQAEYYTGAPSTCAS